MMTKFLLKNKFYLIGAALGATAGYIYYATIGCSTGSCPITSSPVMSVIWGAVMGALLLSMFDRKKKKDEE